MMMEYGNLSGKETFEAEFRVMRSQPGECLREEHSRVSSWYKGPKEGWLQPHQGTEEGQCGCSVVSNVERGTR